MTRGKLRKGERELRKLGGEITMRRPQFTLRALLVLILAVACFFGGIRFGREQQRREDEAVAKAEEEAKMREAVAAVARETARERVLRELFSQEKKLDQLMARFNALMANESDQITDGQRLVSPEAATWDLLTEPRQRTKRGAFEFPHSETPK